MSPSYDFNTRKTYPLPRSDIEGCMDSWGITEWNLLPDNAGRRARYGGPGLSFRMVLRGVEIKLRSDRFWSLEKNARALYLTLEDTRMIERRGLGEIGRQVYKQLPPPPGEVGVPGPRSEPVKDDPYEILGIRESVSLDIAEAAYRASAKRVHPDAGGSEQEMARLNAAITAVRKEHRTAV